jgi:hypothetical protein
MTFPQIVIGDNTECIILISNKSDFNWKANFYIYQGNNEQWAGPLWANDLNLTGTPGFWVELYPRGSFKIVLTGGSQLRVGYLEMETDLSSSVLDVAVSFFYNFRDSAGRLIDSVSIPPSMFSGSEYLFPVERSSRVNTGLAWCPWIWEGPFNVIITLYRENGSIHQQKSVTFFGHKSQFFSEAFDSVPVDFLGMMRVKSQYSMHLAVIRIEHTGTGFQYSGTAPDDFIP